MTTYLDWKDIPSIVFGFIKAALPEIPNNHIMLAKQWVADAPRPDAGTYAVVLLIPLGPESSHKPTIDYTEDNFGGGRKVQSISYRMTAELTITLIGDDAYNQYDKLEPATYIDDILIYLSKSAVGIYPVENNGIEDISAIENNKWIYRISKKYHINWATKKDYSYQYIESVEDFDTSEIIESED